MDQTAQTEFKGWAAPNEQQWAYLAGIFDGEGCVRIQKNGPHAGGKSPSYTVNVSVSNTDRRLMDILSQALGGYGYVKTHKETRPNQRDCFTWSASSRIACRLLKSIRPYVVLKADQIDEAMAFYSRVKPGCTPLTSSELQCREESRIKLIAMKGSLRGKAR